MPLPSDVFLPLNAKYFGFVQEDKPMNLNWDITWSFSFALTGVEHGFCSFLTSDPSLADGIPGQYLGYLGNTASGYVRNGLFAVGFDTTGRFALSSSSNTGVLTPQRKPNSLIIRNYDNRVIMNAPLSSLSTEFILTSSAKVFQTLRFRVTNGGKKLYVDFKKDNTSYIPLTSVSLSGYTLSSNSVVYAGFTFCSPISSNSTNVSTMFMTNFNVEGTSSLPTTETIPMMSILPSNPSYTTISNINSL